MRYIVEIGTRWRGLVLLWALVACRTARCTNDVYVAAWVDEPPAIDAVLDDTAWASGAVQQITRDRYGLPISPEYVSDVWACYDETNLYVAMLNRDPTPALMRAQRRPQDDVGTYGDNENELFIQPSNVETARYYHIAVNSSNSQCDAVVLDPLAWALSGWTSAMVTAASVGPDHWELEMRIPFYAFARASPPIGRTWGWNFNRHVASGVDLWTSWADLTGASWFHEPDKFGDMVFDVPRRGTVLIAR